MIKKGNNNKLKAYFVMHIALFLLSLTGIFSKNAAFSEWFSIRWFFFYGMVLLILFVYAFIWQQVLKILPLTVAFSNKAITLFWGMIWGAIIFNEHISVKMIIGAIVIFFGIYIIARDDVSVERDKK